MPLSNEDKMLDQTRLAFGKHRGKSPREIAQVDPSYIVWMYENVQPRRCSRELYLTCSDFDPNENELDAWAQDIANDW